MNEEKYCKGFNAGYLIKKNEPKLYALIANSPSNGNEYLEGYKDGGTQAYEERKKIISPSLNKSMYKKKDIDLEK